VIVATERRAAECNDAAMVAVLCIELLVVGRGRFLGDEAEGGGRCRDVSAEGYRLLSWDEWV
jgi:hypothetical protein